jgi:hypothetical protein
MLNHQLRSQLIGATLCGEGEVRNTGNRWEGFPTKPERGDFKEVISGDDFARCMALNGKHGIDRTHPAAIVPNDNQPTTTILDMYIDAGCSSIHGILNQLFDDAARPLDNFSCSDLVACIVIEEANRRLAIPDIA